jgi:hypothetical protein
MGFCEASGQMRVFHLADEIIKPPDLASDVLRPVQPAEPGPYLGPEDTKCPASCSGIPQDGWETLKEDTRSSSSKSEVGPTRCARCWGCVVQEPCANTCARGGRSAGGTGYAPQQGRNPVRTRNARKAGSLGYSPKNWPALVNLRSPSRLPASKLVCGCGDGWLRRGSALVCPPRLGLSKVLVHGTGWSGRAKTSMSRTVTVKSSAPVQLWSWKRKT